MTERKHLKQRVRARMAKTGESYASARRRVADVETYRLLGGVAAESSSVANVLANAGMVSPADGRPLTEAMVHGIGGGHGAGYVVFVSDRLDLVTIGVQFRNRWQYPDRWMRTTLERLGLQFEMKQTAGTKAAAGDLRASLDAGRPAIVWHDLGLLGLRAHPGAAEGSGAPPIVVYAIDGELAFVDDRNRSPWTVSLDVLSRSRARVSSYRNRLVSIEPAEIGEARLVKAVRDGLADEVGHLSEGSTSFSLPAIRRWSRMMTDERNARGWPRLFADRRFLMRNWLELSENVESGTLYGGHLRDLTADFLGEAATLLDRPALADVGARYRELAGQWAFLARTTMLPTRVRTFANVRKVRAELRAAFVKGDRGKAAVASGSARLRDLCADGAPWPLDPAATADRFAEVGACLARIHEGEVEALRELKSVI